MRGIPTTAIGRLLMSSWKMKAASGRACQLRNGNLCHPPTCSPTGTSHDCTEQVMDVAQICDGPPPQMKATKMLRALYVVCANAQAALQGHSGRSVSWLCRWWALALLCRQQPGPNSKETSHTFWIAMIAQTPFNTCSMAQERTETSPPASQRKAGLIPSECL